MLFAWFILATEFGYYPWHRPAVWSELISVFLLTASAINDMIFSRLDPWDFVKHWKTCFIIPFDSSLLLGNYKMITFINKVCWNTHLWSSTVAVVENPGEKMLWTVRTFSRHIIRNRCWGWRIGLCNGCN